jgi:hypothetical protein
MVLNGKSGPSADMIAGLYLHYSEYLEWLLTGNTTQQAEPTLDCCDELTRRICEDVIKIFKSDNKDVKDALHQNIKEFKRSIEKDSELRELKETVKRMDLNLKVLMEAGPLAGTARGGGTGKRKKAM